MGRNLSSRNKKVEKIENKNVVIKNLTYKFCYSFYSTTFLFKVLKFRLRTTAIKKIEIIWAEKVLMRKKCIMEGLGGGSDM